MKTTAQTTKPFAKLPKTYPGLMALHLLRPIRDQVDADNASEMIDLLAGHTLNAEQADYLDLLSDLYEKWESIQFPVHQASGAELLRLVLKECSQGAGDLAQLLGIDVSLAYRILRGERQLTAGQIRKVAQSYGFDPVALLPTG
jgi:HTH-type transcriptional regulator/antitoxin HigA